MKLHFMNYLAGYALFPKETRLSLYKNLKGREKEEPHMPSPLYLGPERNVEDFVDVFTCTHMGLS